MNVTLAPGASLRRIAEIVRNAVLRGPDAWEGGSLPERNANPNRTANLLPTDRDVIELFTLVGKRQTPYLLVGGIAMLRYIEGRKSDPYTLFEGVDRGAPVRAQHLPVVRPEWSRKSVLNSPFAHAAILRMCNQILVALGQRPAPPRQNENCWRGRVLPIGRAEPFVTNLRLCQRLRCPSASRP